MSAYTDASLVMIPSGYKDGTLYSAKPTNGDGDFTFSRGSNLAATRVNSDGLIEKGRENIVKYSNAFNSGWDQDRILSVTGGQSGYDGSTDAFLVVADSTNDNHNVRRSDSTLTGVQTNSVYAKYSGYHLQLRATGIGSTTAWVNFDLQNGTIENSGGGQIDADIESAGNGFYRCSITYIPSSASYIGIIMIQDPVADAALPKFVGDLTSGIIIQDAQAESGLVSTPYIETGASTAQAGILEDMPRLDYSGGATCPSLLLEPQRTNNIPYSEYQSGSGFNLGPNITWNGFVESPEGVNNASKFTSSAASACYVQVLNVTIPAGDFTFSMWVRGVSGTFNNTSFYIPSHTGTQATMNEKPVAGEDWKLVYGSGTNTSGSSYVRTVTLPFYDQPAGAVWEMYGFQLEAGSYPTSYIPTYGGASVTRGNDTSQPSLSWVTSNVGNNGTWFMEIDDLTFEITGTSAPTNRFGDGSNSNCLGLTARNFGQNKQISFTKAESGSVTTLHGHTVNGTFKFALVWTSAGGLKLFVNGIEEYDASFTQPTWSNLVLNNSSREAFQEIKQVSFFPTALSDDECIELTTI